MQGRSEGFMSAWHIRADSTESAESAEDAG